MKQRDQQKVVGHLEWRKVMGLTVPDLFGSTPFVHVAAYACEVIAILMLSQDQSVLPWLLSGVSDYKPVSACFFHFPMNFCALLCVLVSHIKFIMCKRPRTLFGFLKWSHHVLHTEVAQSGNEVPCDAQQLGCAS